MRVMPGLDLMYWIIHSLNDEDGELIARAYSSSMIAVYFLCPILAALEQAGVNSKEVAVVVSFAIGLIAVILLVDRRRRDILAYYKEKGLNASLSGRFLWVLYAALVAFAIIAASVWSPGLSFIALTLFAVIPADKLLLLQQKKKIKGDGGN